MGYRELSARAVFLVLVAMLFMAATVSVNAEVMDRGVVIRPLPAEAYVFLGNYFFREGNSDVAGKLFEKAVQYGDNAVAHHNLGVIRHGEGEQEMAEEEFRKAIAADQEYARAHNSLGLLVFSRGEYAEAAEHFAKVVELTPENAQAHFDLGVSIGNTVRYNGTLIGRLAVALEHFREAERLQPGYPHAQQNIDVLESILESYYALKSAPGAED